MRPRVRLRTVVGIALLSLSVFFLPIFLVWKKSLLMEKARRNDGLRGRIEALRNENALSVYAQNRLLGRERIETAAREKLGLEYPANQDLRFIARPVPRVRESRLAGFLPFRSEGGRP